MCGIDGCSSKWSRGRREFVEVVGSFHTNYILHILIASLGPSNMSVLSALKSRTTPP